MKNFKLALLAIFIFTVSMTAAYAVVEEKEQPPIISPEPVTEVYREPSSGGNNDAALIAIGIAIVGILIYNTQPDEPNNCPVITDQNYDAEKADVDPWIIPEC